MAWPSIALCFLRLKLHLLAFNTITEHKTFMPTLTRLIVFLAAIAAVIYGAMFALATFVKPTPTDMVVEIPSSKLKPELIEPPAPTPETTESPDNSSN